MFAWLIDVLLIGLICVALWFALMLFGLLTLGLGLPLLGILPFVPFCYHMLFLAGPASATPGQSALGLIVRRNDDFGRRRRCRRWCPRCCSTPRLRPAACCC